MIVRSYSMLDAKARSYGAPIVFQNDDVAKRSALAILGDNNSDMAKFPADFSLWFIGEFSTETGIFTASAPTLVFSLIDLVV